MKLNGLIEHVICLRGQQYDTEMIVGWVNEIEGQAVEQVVNNAAGMNVTFKPYQYEQDAETELLIPDRFLDVYVNYLLAKIDFHNQEAERYNNDAAMLEAAWQEYEAWYIRTYRPKPLPQFRNF